MSSLFVASLGNPAPYERTLHSAGHVLLQALAAHLDAPPFQPNYSLQNGLTTEATLRNDQKTRLTLWQSPSLMNRSGPSLVKAYKSWLSQQQFSSLFLPPHRTAAELLNGNLPKLEDVPRLYRPRMRLVLVHDELEVVSARFQVRYGGAERSSRGHRGVMSVVDTLVTAGLLDGFDEANKWRSVIEKAKKKRKQLESAEKGDSGISSTAENSAQEAENGIEAALRRSLSSPVLTRVQIGIGRPGERDPDTVARYVLSEMRGSLYVRVCAHGRTFAQFLESMIV
ncbi:hypothetical protein VTO42DRAFT_3260 [Malbranchea cinnamomea]